jgi:phage terminase small subunit
MSGKEIDKRENFGDLSPAMQALTEMQRRFVQLYIAEVMVKPLGAPTRAAIAAGYGKRGTSSKARHENVVKAASDMLRDPSRNTKVLAAIAEESRRMLRLGHPEAVAALYAVIRDPSHKDHVRAISSVLDRTDPVTTRHDIAVTHKHVDVDAEALEELKAARSLGATRDRLVELFGSNGLDRLEAREAIEIAQRSAAAKVINHE